LSEHRFRAAPFLAGRARKRGRSTPTVRAAPPFARHARHGLVLLTFTFCSSTCHLHARPNAHCLAALPSRRRGSSGLPRRANRTGRSGASNTTASGARLRTYYAPAAPPSASRTRGVLAGPSYNLCASAYARSDATVVVSAAVTVLTPGDAGAGAAELLAHMVGAFTPRLIALRVVGASAYFMDATPTCLALPHHTPAAARSPLFRHATRAILYGMARTAMATTPACHLTACR